MLGDARIAEKFADFFDLTCSMKQDNNEKVQRDRTLMQERLAGYSGLQRDYESVVNLDFIQTIIDELALGKAASYNMISAEHLKYCHPIVAVFIATLFSSMISITHVPAEFGKGITVPLLQQDSKGNGSKIEDYRGITILPAISKVFEFVLLKFAAKR